MRVEEWMNRDVVTVQPDDSFHTAMHLIRQKGIRCLLVVEGKRLLGIVTDRNLRENSPPGVSGAGIHPSNHASETLTVRRIMTTPAISIRPDQTVEDAALLLLAHRIEGLPVVRNGELAGLITESDILQAFLQVRGKGPLDIAASIVALEMENRAP